MAGPGGRVKLFSNELVSDTMNHKASGDLWATAASADLFHSSLVEKQLKIRPREYQTWLRSVRFTPRGSEKYPFHDFCRSRKIRPRAHQKWMRSVRFPPRGSEKRALGNFTSVCTPSIKTGRQTQVYKRILDAKLRYKRILDATNSCVHAH